MTKKLKWDEVVGGEVSFISEDAEVVTFVVASDPVLLEGKYRGKLSERIGCPIVTKEGFTLLIVGKRLARRISKHKDKFPMQAFTVTRIGEHGDIDTVYPLKVCADEGLTAELLKLMSTIDVETELKDAVAAAEEIVSQ